MDKRNTIAAFFGRKYSGKTELTRQIIERKRRVLVIDTTEDYGGVLIKSVDDLADYINKRGAGDFHISFRDTGRDGVPIEEKFRMLQMLRDCWLIFEEAGKWVPPTMGHSQVTWFVNYGRHNGISSIFIARRPSEIHRDVTANADVIVSFQQQEPRDLAYIREFASAEAANQVATLGPNEWEIVLGEDTDFARELEEISDAVGNSDRSFDFGSSDDHSDNRPSTTGEGGTSAGASPEGAGPSRVVSHAESGRPGAGSDPHLEQAGRSGQKGGAGRVRRRRLSQPAAIRKGPGPAKKES